RSINISHVRDISYTYDQDYIFKTIKVGYKKWESESASGIDDPQTKRTYTTGFKYNGQEFTLESSGIAASLTIETTRRKRVEKSSDYKFDNDLFIIAHNVDDVSPDTYIPELDENFNSVSNLLNSETRYNLILTPMRNLLRWAKYIGGCMQSYATSAYKFVSGEGNYDMISEHAGGDNGCQAVLLDELGESQDISLEDYNDDLGYYFLPLLYDITFPITWDDFNEIRNNRKNAIGISQTTTGHKTFHIKKMEYSILTGKVESLNAWPVEYMPIQVIDQDFNRYP